MQLGDEQPFRFLIHDRDTKFGQAFDDLLRCEGITVIQTRTRRWRCGRSVRSGPSVADAEAADETDLHSEYGSLTDADREPSL
jgi:hypothetical protein